VGKNPSIGINATSLRKLAKAAGVTTDWLMGADELRPTRADVLDAGPVEKVLETYPWPESLEPDEMVEVARRLRMEHFKNAEQVPLSYWPVRIRRLIAEVQGRAKDAPTRLVVEDVDLTEESPEVRAHRKKSKKR
jgi:hypothetical protein